MGGAGLARILRLRTPATWAHVPLFAAPGPEEATGLERAINVARIVGMGLLAIGIASGQLGPPLAVFLAAVVTLQQDP